MRLSTSQGFNTSLLYTARMAARSVGAITSSNSTNSNSVIHTSLHGILTEPCLFIVMTYLSIALTFGLQNLHTFAYPAFQQRKILVQLFHRDFCITLCGRNLCMPQNFAYAFYRHPVRYGHHCIRMALMWKVSRLFMAHSSAISFSFTFVHALPNMLNSRFPLRKGS